MDTGFGCGYRLVLPVVAPGGSCHSCQFVPVISGLDFFLEVKVFDSAFETGADTV